MRIVTYNIFEGGFASDGADRSGAIQTVLNSTQPDIIALQEVNREGFLYSLARFFNMPTALFGPGNRGFNLGLLSKYPVTDWQMHEERAIFRHGFSGSSPDYSHRSTRSFCSSSLSRLCRRR